MSADKRPDFICIHVLNETCTQVTNCCSHRLTHKPEENGCGKRDCRFAPSSVAECVPVTVEKKPESIPGPVKEAGVKEEKKDVPAASEPVETSPAPAKTVTVRGKRGKRR